MNDINEFKLHSALAAAFNSFAKERRRLGKPYPDHFLPEWNQKLESLGIVLSEERPWQGMKEDPLVIVLSNPAGGWIQMEHKTAMKILTLGMP